MRQAFSFKRKRKKWGSPEEGDQSWEIIISNSNASEFWRFKSIKKIKITTGSDKRNLSALNRMFKDCKRKASILKSASSYNVNEEKRNMAENSKDFQDQGLRKQEMDWKSLKVWVGVPRTKWTWSRLECDMNEASSDLDWREV